MNYMMQEKRKIVRFSEESVEYLDNLVAILLEKDYFGFREDAKRYVTELTEYIERYISILPTYQAPTYFNKYYSGMQYVSYSPNRRTTWYFFFRQENEVPCNMLYYKQPF
jgi:hypothetical protein